MRLPKLSNPCCAMPVREMSAANPSSRGQSNSSPPSKRKSVNAAVPRIPNSSRKNIPCRVASPRCPEALRRPRSTPCHGDYLRGSPSWQNLSQSHQDAEKSSRPERRRPRRHQQLSAMTLRQLRQTQCVRMRSPFSLFLNSNACVIKYQELMPDPFDDPFEWVLPRNPLSPMATAGRYPDTLSTCASVGSNACPS